MKVITNNKKAFHDYFITKTYEAGISLQGTEIKSLRLGKCSIKEAHVIIKNKEAWLIGSTIPIYTQGNIYNHEEQRKRKLLLHKKEIINLEFEVKTQRLALIPLKVYFTEKGKVKVEFGLAKGKKKYDKRQEEAKKSDLKKIKQNV